MTTATLPSQTERDEALRVLAEWASASSPHLNKAAALERSWQLWLTTLFAKWVSNSAGQLVPFGPHQTQFWNHVWEITRGVKPDPFLGIWPRGGAKSTSVELACAALAARGARRYCLYICATQEQADDHVQNIAALLESPLFAEYYPAVAQRLLGKYGSSRGWRRNRLRTASGFTADAIGLDTAARGVKLEETRPDLLVFDDLDEELDGPPATEKKITVLTHKLLPAGSDDSATIAIQNLVIGDGIFARLAGIDGASSADFLQNRIVSGPFPAVINPQIVVEDGKHYLKGGTPVWEGQNLKKCQQQIDEWGYSSWLVEAQQEVDIPPGGLFASIDFDRIVVQLDDVPELIRVVVWVDPAVTSTDKSDSHGIQVDGLGVDNRVYRLWSWEGRSTPALALRKAILKALEYKAEHVGVETDQGGDVWELAYNNVWEEMVSKGEVHLPVVQQFQSNPTLQELHRWDQGALQLPQARGTLNALWFRPAFVSDKAGAGYGPKSHRASRMLVDYENDVFRHVLNIESTHLVLRRALQRFPLRKPFDLTDAAFWAWNDLRGSAPNGVGASDDTPVSAFSTRDASVLGATLHRGQPGGPDAAYNPETSDRIRPARIWRRHNNRTIWRISPPHIQPPQPTQPPTEVKPNV